MEIQLLCIGKTEHTFWSDSIEEYKKRLQYYVKFTIVCLNDNKIQKRSDPLLTKEAEAKALLQKIKPNDTVILLDEKGESYSSIAFAKQIDNHMNYGKKRILFILGGPYGFSKEIYMKYPKLLSLSQMTFSHQMVRLFFCEQLYRAFTIINNHPYHNN